MKARAGLLVGLVGVALAAHSTPRETPTPPPTQTIAQYSVADFYENSEYFGASFSADGTKILVSSNRSGIWNAYAIPAAGGEPSPSRTRRPTPSSPPRTSPTTAASCTRATKEATN